MVQLDNGATHHLSNSLQNLNLGRDYLDNQLLLVGSGQELHISHIGYACFNISCDSVLHVNDILCIPHITKTSISISKLLKNNEIIIEFVHVKIPLSFR